MELVNNIPNYTLSLYQEDLMKIMCESIESIPSGVSYVSTGPRLSGTKDALTLMLANLLVTKQNFHITVLCPYRNIAEHLAELTYHWLVQMKKNDEVRRLRTKIYKGTSGICFTSVQDVVVRSWNPEVLIITEAAYIPPSSIAHLFLPTTSATKVIVMNNDVAKVKYIDELWASARKDITDKVDEDKKEEVD
jgi:hypothetical protein